MYRLSTLLILLALLIAPAAAQSPREAAPSNPLTDLAALVPANTTFFFAGRADAGYLETLKGLWPRLNDEVFGLSSFPTYEQVFETGTLGNILNDTIGWRGDVIALAAIDPATFKATLDDINDGFVSGGLVLIFTVKDRAAAKAWLESELDLTSPERTIGAYDLYTFPAQDLTPAALLSDDHLLITTMTEQTSGILTNDFSPLNRADRFIQATSALPLAATGYDFIAYINIENGLRELNAREFITREITPYRTFRFALADFVGSVAIGGVLSEGRHLILDGAWQYGDPAALADYGIDTSRWITQPIDPTFFIHAPENTQFFLQSTDLAGTYNLGLDLLSALGDIASTSPDLARALDLPSDMADRNLGALLRGTLTMGFAGLTGLNLNNDVLARLEDTDFALTFTLSEDATSPIDFTVDAALIARHTGDAQTWLDAVTQALALYGYPSITPQPVGSGQAIDFSPAIDPILLSTFGASISDNPAFDILLGVNESVAALGTRPSVEQALNAPTDLSAIRIGFPSGYSLFLPEPHIIGYINGQALTSFPDWYPSIDSATFSVVASETGLLGRATISLNTSQER